MLRGRDFFVGFVSKAAPDAASFMAEPEAPSNYKKPEAIREYKEKARETFLERAASQAVTGGLTAVCLQDATGAVLLDAVSDAPGAVSSGLVNWLLANQFEDYPWTIDGGFTPARRLWGFDVAQMLRIAGLEAMAYDPDRPYPPLRLWYHNNGATDPYDVLTGSAERRSVSLAGLCRYLGVDTSAVELDPAVNALAHRDLAKVARELSLRAGLAAFVE